MRDQFPPKALFLALEARKSYENKNAVRSSVRITTTSVCGILVTRSREILFVQSKRRERQNEKSISDHDDRMRSIKMERSTRYQIDESRDARRDARRAAFCVLSFAGDSRRLSLRRLLHQCTLGVARVLLFSYLVVPLYLIRERPDIIFFPSLHDIREPCNTNERRFRRHSTLTGVTIAPPHLQLRFPAKVRQDEEPARCLELDRLQQQAMRFSALAKAQRV